MTIKPIALDCWSGPFRVTGRIRRLTCAPCQVGRAARQGRIASSAKRTAWWNSYKINI